MKYYIKSRGETMADARSMPAEPHGQAFLNAEIVAEFEYLNCGGTNAGEYPMTVVIVNGTNISQWQVAIRQRPSFRATVKVAVAELTKKPPTIKVAP